MSQQLVTFKIILLSLFMLIIFGNKAWALEKKPYTDSHFEALQKEGKMILVDIYANWCGTCKKQQAAIQQYREKHPHRELHVLEVDFDKQKEVVKKFRAPRQSTLLLYKGDQQFWYSVAESRPDIITEKVEQAFNFIPKKR